MNATLRIVTKTCLVAATLGLVGSQMAALLAQDDDGSSGQSEGVKVLLAQGFQPATQTAAVQSSPDSDSAVQKELQKIYKKNNRDMPSMNLADAPNTQGPTALPQQNPAARPGPAPAATATAAPAAAAPKPNWFERTFHVGRGKRKPAAPAETPAPQPPAAPRNAPYRYANPNQPARPAQPYSRAPLAAAPPYQGAPAYQAPPSGTNPTFTPPPVTAGPAASAPPAQPQLREPSPLAPSPTARELTVRPQPPAVRPARPRVSSQPMLDESEMGDDDGESLDLDDDERQPAPQAPKILANRNDAKAAADSPYSGLKISPNEEEQRIKTMPQAAPAEESADASNVEELPGADSKTDEKIASDKPAEKQPKTAAPAATVKPKTGIAPDDDDDDDEDDDDEVMLSLPTAKTSSKSRADAEPAVLKAAKVMEKMAVPVAPAPSAAPVAASAPAAMAADVAAAAKPVPATSANVPVESSPTVPAVAAPANPVQDSTPEPAAPPVNGLKGICPVALKDSRKLIDARPSIQSAYKGKTYMFSSAEAKQTFDENPHKYAPVIGGNDVVKLTTGEKEVEGTLEHAAWYRGRLYLFSTAESRLEFVETPSKFVVED